MKCKIIKEERVFDGYLKLDEGLIEHELEDGKITRYNRIKVERPDVITILLYNKTSDTVILAKQFRYPIAHKMKSETPGQLIEVVAGKIDPGETPQQAAVRECEEEVGYVVKEKELIFLSRGFASPGYTSERMYSFAAVVTDKHKKKKGGGKDGEYEDIEIIEMPFLQFKAWVENGSIADMKTKLAFFEAGVEGVFKPKRTIPKVPKEDRTQLNEGKDDNQLKMF
jgi:GDP-mannose pyrophosphatase NudK